MGFFWFLEARRNDLSYDHDILAMRDGEGITVVAVTDADIDRLIEDTLGEVAFSPEATAPSAAAPEAVASTARLALNDNATTEDIRDYGHAIGAIIANLYTGPTGNETALLVDALADSDPSGLTALVAQAAAYEDARSALSQIEIPTSAAPNHLDLMNAYARIARLVGTMSSADKNPSAALVSAKTFQQEQTALATLYARINAYFRDIGIEFSPKDGARVTVILPDA